MALPAIPPGSPVSPAAYLNKTTLVVQQFGTSLEAQSAYFPYGTPLTLAPNWAPSTNYAVNNIVQSNGIVYYCSVAGQSASSGGPSGPGTVTDGGVTWVSIYWYNNKAGNDPLTWVESFSLGRIVFDQTIPRQGIYATLRALIVVAGGTGYAPGDTWQTTNGANGTFTLGAGGTITAAVIVNPGYGGTGIQYGSGLTITTSTGSGCQLSPVEVGHGTFGQPGGTTADMVARLPEVIALSRGRVDAMIVGGGPNDITVNTVTTANLATLVAATIKNLKTCYEGLMNAGIAAIICKMPPRLSATVVYTGLQLQYYHQVQTWIEAYARKEPWANPGQMRYCALVDMNRYLADGTSSGVAYIGGTGGGAAAMSKDGTHWSPRSAQYQAIGILAALSSVFGQLPPTAPRSVQYSDGFDINLAPGGNCLEAAAWQPLQAYVYGQSCSNSGNFYRCKSVAGGTSAASGGPAGTGSTIADGSNGLQWAYVRPVGASVFGSGSQALPGSTGGVTCSGFLDASCNFARLTGSASGTVIGKIENPWSDGQTGTRQALYFNLSGGGAGNEFWHLYLNAFGPGYYGIPASDYGIGQYYVEAEIELSAILNLLQVSLEIVDGGNAYYRNQANLSSNSGSSTLLTEMASYGEMLELPNNGKRLLRSGIMPVPPAGLFSSFYPSFTFAFNAAGQASAAVKLNWWAIKRANSL